MASGWRQGGVRGLSRWSCRRQERVRMRQDASGTRQDGVRKASGRRQEYLASGWRQDDVKRRRARINYPATFHKEEHIFISCQAIG